MARQTLVGKRTSQFPLLTVFVIVILLVGAYIFYINKDNYSDTSPTPSNSSQTKTFRSETMEFEIEVPEGFEVEEKFTTVKLKNTKGEILIARNSTNFDSLEEYLNDSRLQSEKFVVNTYLEINNLSSVEGFVGEQKVYFLYASNNVYSISTPNKDLYIDLGQVAQSFRYIPK